MSKATGFKAGKAKTKTATKIAASAAKKVALAKHVKKAVKNAKAAKATAPKATAPKSKAAPAGKAALKKPAPKPPVKSTPKAAVAKTAATKAVPVAKAISTGKTSQAAAAAPRTIATAKPAPPVKSEGIPKKMVARPKPVNVVLPPDYRPSDSEPFMNDMHRAYFRKRLQDWKDDILRQTRETLAILHEDSTQHADLADRATSETDRATELRTRDRQRKLISKIDAAIARIDDGSYGYCEDTGEPIGLKRLDARPIATLSVEAQERHERREKVYREE